MIYFGYIHNVQHGYNLQDNWLIKKFIGDGLISYHSMCYKLWWWVIYFLTCPLFYIKLVQIVVKILFFWTTCEEQTQFLYQGGHWTYFTHRMDWTSKFEEDGSLFVESRWWNFFGQEGNPSCYYANMFFYIMIQFQWGFTTNLVGLFKEVQNKASNVEMKDVFLSHGRWEIPWPSSLTYSLNIIDYCVVEVNEDGIEIVNDVEPLNYANHDFVSRDEDTFVNEVDVLVKTSIQDIEKQIEMMGFISDLVL